MAKYYLSAMLNGSPILTITSGKLKEIDDFIINNNFYNVESLFDYAKNYIDEELDNDDCIKFEIHYKNKGEIKTKPLFFEEELSDFYNSNELEYIYDLLSNDSEFKTQFDIKYVNQLVTIKRDTPISTIAHDYLHDFNHKTFSKLYNSLVSKRREDNRIVRVYNNNEELEMGERERIYSYTKQRDMYFDAYFWGKDLPSNKIMIKIDEYIDEFDDQMAHDPFPDQYRLYGKRIEDIEFIFQKPKKKTKKLTYENPNQLTWFDE